MIAEGHQVASHTWSHYNLSSLPSDLRKQQMVRNEQALVNIIGKFPTYMRPPFSECDAACQTDLNALGYHRIYFDLDTTDTVNETPATIQGAKDVCKAAISSLAKDDDLLSIQHDIVEQSVYNLTAYWLGLIKSKGWKAVPVGTCLGDPQANWYRSGTPGTGPESTSVSGSSATVTSKPTTSSTSTSSISTSSTSTSSTSTKPTTTSKPTTTTTKPTTTTTKASSTPTPTSKCLYTTGKFCGTIDDFTTSSACSAAAAKCNAQSLTCLMDAGLFNMLSCTKWTTSYCTPLASYCRTCGSKCSLSAFEAKL